MSDRTPVSEKIAVVDGSAVHDVGRLLLNVTNWGLIGSQYTVATPYGEAPSGRWPGPGGLDHLWGAGLWIGAIADGERSVTSGEFEHELLPSEAPEDTIYRTYWQAPAAVRFPLPGADDDGDGVEDEDPPNGRDDDGDGSIDEDGAGAGDQHFRCEMADTQAVALYPDHRPLQISVVQQSIQWSTEEVADFVGFEFTIRNFGTTALEDVYIGMFADFDVDDPPGGAAEGADDLAGRFAGTVEAYPGQTVPVQLGYMREGAGATTSGVMGFVPLGHPTDPTGASAPAEVGMRAFRRLRAGRPFEDGGDPTNDAERYELLATEALDADATEPDDYRVLVSVGPFAELTPGEELSVAFALVAGADVAEAARQAARARLAYEGLAFDRDGDPSNGAEFVVHWLGPEEVAVAIEDEDGDGDADDGPPAIADGFELSAAPNPFNPILEISCELPSTTVLRLSVVDLAGRELRLLHDGRLDAGSPRWIWDGCDASGRAVGSGVYLIRMQTAQRVLSKSVTLVR
jgi:hypothetical protein